MQNETQGHSDKFEKTADMNKNKYFIFLGSNFKGKILRIEQYLPFYLSINNEVICFEYPQFLKLSSILLGKIPLMEKVSPNLLVFHSFGLLPFGRTFSLINYLNHLVNCFLFKLIMGNKIKKPTIIISFTPEIIYILSQLDLKRKIYYYVLDEYTSLPCWKNPLQKNQLLALEKKMLKVANKVIAISSVLYEKYKKSHPHVVYFPTPAELSIYLDYLSKKDKTIPYDLINVPRPAVGFMGALFDWRINMELVLKTLRVYSNISFVFIGELEIKDKKKREAIFGQKNFYYLGLKKFKELPQYLSLFDVCIIPYEVNSYGKAAYPVKVNEYLAMGKPVVTTALPALKYLKDKNLIYWARDGNEFIKLIKIALAEKKNPEVIKKRIEEAKKNSWEERIKEFISIIEND